MSASIIATLPKVLLHDHLDGGLRPQTVLELANDIGYEGLPENDLESLTQWFHQRGSGSLEQYLEAFPYTLAVMQTPEAIARVAYEAAVDLADDGVVYAEIRFAPTLNTIGGLELDQVIDAALAGLSDAADRIEARILVDAMRQEKNSLQVAEAAARFVDRGVVGFDLAGPEVGFPASLHAEACALVTAAGLRLTIHAGEGDGPHSIADALQCCGPERIGHGARIIEDTTVRDGEIVECGPTARTVRDSGIPLELCPTSNLDTNMYPSAVEHPIGLLHRAGFSVTVNTDNRLMSRTSMSNEFELLIKHQGFGLSDLRQVTLNAIDSAFCDDDTRHEVREVVAAAYSAS